MIAPPHSGQPRGWRRAAGGALLVLIAIAGALGALYARSPPGALDTVDRLFTLGTAARVAQGVPFAPAAGDRLDIWAAASGGARRPVVVFFYGGSWVSGRRQDYGFVARAYAGEGFVAVVPDYRKVPGVRFPTFVSDAAAAVAWVHRNIARYGGDPDRILLVGHSAGGYLAMMLALDRRYLAAQGIDPAVVRAAAGLAGPYDFYPFTWQPARDAMGAAPDPRQTQPITFARADAPPLWLATGTADGTIRPRNAYALAARQRALGSRRTVLRTYAGLGHQGIVMALSRPFRGLAPVLAESAAFLRAQSAE
ncbi:alpha/beta hydrolase [Sphingomonas profundi]|uniref:alpha/beta hydrolase n=1 Tax=Alterirhizorhabdus profundi TaxID=2681549 RepID=UPI001E2F54FD|nr:alpha/beta hydrolase [Sphingomonas profundi]